MKTFMKTVGIAAIASAFGLGAALAGEMPKEDMATDMIQKDSAAVFATIDTDADGAVTKAEWAAWQGITEADVDLPAEGDADEGHLLFADYDLDSSGDISKDEFVEASLAHEAGAETPATETPVVE